MNEFFKRAATCALSVMMAVSCMAPVTAYAMDDTAPVTIENHPDAIMLEQTPVFAIGSQSYYKVNDDLTVSFADREESPEYEAIPSTYIEGSVYNKTGASYGIYVTSDKKVHFVDLMDCLHDSKTDAYTWYHGTSDAATVSDDKVEAGRDTATNEDPNASTQFYIYLDNDTEIPPETPETETVEPAKTPDGRVEYEITVGVVDHLNMKATIPLYVCMYGFRSTGNVVTPTSDQYQLRNYSTIDKNSRVTINDIVKVTHYAKLYDEDHSDEEIYSIAFDEAKGEYTYWYTDPSVQENWEQPAIYTVIRDKHINASGECYAIYIDGKWDFKAAGVLDGDALRVVVPAIEENHQLSNDFIVNGVNFGKQFEVGAERTDAATTEGLAIKVSQIQAEPSTWRVVPMSTRSLKRGEVAMTITPTSATFNPTAIDLANCSAKLDITENGWFLAAPKTLQADNTVAYNDATTLPLITNAKIAGGNVNDIGCTPVVKVTYSIIPMIDVDDTQTSTVAGVVSNRS